jgi:cadherin 23
LCVAVTSSASAFDSGTNFPPRFASQPGDPAEIVLRIKEGPGSLQREIYRLIGEDPDSGDQLQFGVLGAVGADLLRIENHSPTRNQAAVYLRKELDRETQDSYQLVLTLTDGKLGKGNYVSRLLFALFIWTIAAVAQ